MPKVDSQKAKYKVWVIHTGIANYRIMIPENDPDTASLVKSRQDGFEALEGNKLAKTFRAKDNAAESLPWTKKREENMLYAVANEDGDFICEDINDARAILKLTANDPEPKPYLDPNSPSLDEVKSK